MAILKENVKYVLVSGFADRANMPVYSGAVGNSSPLPRACATCTYREYATFSCLNPSKDSELKAGGNCNFHQPK